VDGVYGNPKRLLFDEMQNIARWKLLANRLQRQGRDLTITGSNAHLLGSELATHLTGRHVQLVLFPFSFEEYCRWRGGELTEPERGEALRQYAESGGYPEPLVRGIGGREYLTTLWRSTLYKDIVVRHRIRSIEGLEDLATYLMANVAREYSLRTLAQVARLRSHLTAQKYLRYLEQAFLTFPLRRFSIKAKEQALASRKMYCIDYGLVTAASARFSADMGSMYGNLVAIALHRRALDGQLQCFYWRGAREEEVDFVVKEGLNVTRPIQVCIRADDPRTHDREVRALLRAGDELRCKELLILTDATQREEEASWYGRKGTIRWMPVWRWLMATA
jgi:uncharacterized protein